MTIKILSNEQRSHYGCFADNPTQAQLARYFHLDATDRILIDTLRGTQNRLGCAVQLGVVRFLGTFPERFDNIPDNVIHTLASQIDEPLDTLLVAYQNNRQRWRHRVLICKHYGFKTFESDNSTRFRLTRWLYALCWNGDDRPSLLFDRATQWLTLNKVLLPGATTLERFVGHIRHRAETHLWKQLSCHLSPEQTFQITALLDPSNPDTLGHFDNLRVSPTRRSQKHFLEQLDRLDAIRALNLNISTPKSIPATIIERLARMGRVSKSSALAAMAEPRRTANMVALFQSLKAMAQDDAMELAEVLTADLFRDAKEKYQKARLRSLRDLDEAALVMCTIGKFVLAEDELPLNEWREKLFERISREKINAAVDKIDSLANPDDASSYATQLQGMWKRAHRLFFNSVFRIEMDTSPAGKPLKEALSFLKQNKNWARMSMKEAPVGAISRTWKKHVLDEKGRVKDQKSYVLAILDIWRNALKQRDVFASPGIRFGDPRQGLIEESTWKTTRLTASRVLGHSLDGEVELNALSTSLDTAFQEAVRDFDTNPDLRIETRKGKAHIVMTPLDKMEETESLQTLRPLIHARMPKVELPDILLEVSRWTDFTQKFTHLGERKADIENFETSLCAVLVSESCNIGYEPMIQFENPALRRHRLSWTAQNFIRPETITKANALIVAAHNALPIVKLWGSGEVASADGMRFITPASTIHAGPNVKYFGHKRGITYYNLVSDQNTGLNALVIPGTIRDSLSILALLLGQETELQPFEIMTDTAAYSDAIFGIFWMLGYQFCPRLADIGNTKLWRIDKEACYSPFDTLDLGTISLDLRKTHWEDLIRFATSLKLGHIQATSIMRTLHIKDRPTALARALSHLGRVVKTIHVLRYINDPVFRRRILIQLNRQEYRHKLGRRLCHGNRGEIRKPLRQGQEEQLGAMGLTLNIIAHWNARYMQEAVSSLRQDGHLVNNDDVAHLSPLIHKHINFLGRYHFSLPEDIKNGLLRQLNQPSFEHDL